MDSVTRFLGLDFCNRSAAYLQGELLARPPAQSFSYLVTPNADHLQRLLKTPALAPLYTQAGWRLLDSRFIYLVSQRLGLAPPPVITGADFAPALLAQLDGGQAAVIGMTPENFARLQARYPRITFFHHAPPQHLHAGDPAFAAAAQFARQTAAPFTFIALGSPLQEQLAHSIAISGQAVGIGLCIGSALDFAAGAKTRAPLWMRHAGLEWLFRLAQEPRRLAGRYLRDDPALLWHLAFRARTVEVRTLMRGRKKEVLF